MWRKRDNDDDDDGDDGDYVDFYLKIDYDYDDDDDKDTKHKGQFVRIHYIEILNGRVIYNEWMHKKTGQYLYIAILLFCMK